MKRWLLLVMSGLVLAWSVGTGALHLRAEEPAEKKAEAAAEKPAAEATKEEHGSADHAKDGLAKDAHGAAGHDTHGGEHGADGHGHHDPHDLTHGNGSAQLKSAQELRFDLAIATFAVFVLLLLILTKFAWKPIAHGLDQREETIARQIEEARLAAEKGARQLQEYEAKLAAAVEESRKIIAEARKDAEVAKGKIMAEAQEAAAKERDRAVADITSAKNQALQEIAQKSVSTAVSLASHIIRREVKPEDHEQLIDQSLAQFTSLN
ncbi:MAG: F0F1 ATP synthase subunit B [Pirellulaceae bacterium]|nr:F0F1 ATP synthase subunit B [Pirellulaceae bacterium]